MLALVAVDQRNQQCAQRPPGQRGQRCQQHPPDANGDAEISVVLNDGGSGTNTSAPQSVIITVISVNDPPFFTMLTTDTVSEDSDFRQVSNFATVSSVGPDDESGQLNDLFFEVTVVNPEELLWVNIWYDFNRDGDWDDFNIEGIPQWHEWAVRNQALIGLPAGTHVIESNKFFSDHPKDMSIKNPDPIWMRITLSGTPWRGGRWRSSKIAFTPRVSANPGACPTDRAP